MKNLFKLFICIFLILRLPSVVNSAEILQINSSNIILIGDQNRNLTVSLICTNVEEKNESSAVKLLQSNFPRGTKVKIRPYEMSNQNLSAKVFKVSDQVEMNQILINNHLSENICQS